MKRFTSLDFVSLFIAAFIFFGGLSFVILPHDVIIELIHDGVAEMKIQYLSIFCDEHLKIQDSAPSVSRIVSTTGRLINRHFMLLADHLMLEASPSKFQLEGAIAEGISRSICWAGTRAENMWSAQTKLCFRARSKGWRSTVGPERARTG